MSEPGPHEPLVAFAHRLRGAGVTIGTGQIVAFCDAVAVLGPRDATDLYWAGRATLVTGAADLDLYDEVFTATFRPEQRPPPVRDPRPPTVVTMDLLVDAERGEGDGGHEAVRVGAVASQREVLRHRRFDQLTLAERRALQRLMIDLRVDPPARRSRRSEPAPSGSTPDIRRSLRRALRTHGELLERSWRRRRVRPRPLVLLLDVSGSMSSYSRALLGFAHVVSRGGARVEVFCFGTRITRVTDALRSRDPDAALTAAAEQVVDWDGGTRIGASLTTFLRRWGRAGMARGAVVVICSDGLDRGDPHLVTTGMERLARLSHRIVWVNPLRGDPRYRPLARGMAAALPHVDAFLSGHDLASLDELAGVIRGLR